MLSLLTDHHVVIVDRLPLMPLTATIITINATIHHQPSLSPLAGLLWSQQ
jgi:hypothetical protein